MQGMGGVSSIMAKRKKNKSEFSQKMTKLCIKAGITVATIMVMFASIFTIWVFSGADYEFLNNAQKLMSLKLNSTIYCEDKETGEYVVYDHIVGDENRVWIDIEKIPPSIQNAIVAIEDERFYQHSGVDIKRTLGAVINELSGGSTYGGSTLTQQLVKNLTGDNERSRARKIREILRAISLETRLSKSEILELYLNTIYLGQNCYGVETASLRYFGKSAEDLTLAEATCIAGITQYPSQYDPIVNPERNEEKRQLVLGKMLEHDYITKEQYKNAKETVLEFNTDASKANDGKTTYFTDYIIEQIIEDLMEKNNCTREMATLMLGSGGYKIYATIDTDVQKAMDKIYQDASNRKYFVSANGVSVQSAMVICDPYTGHVKGLVGGVGKKQSQRELNRATQTIRQPGSSLKPLSVYAPAIDTGMYTPASVINDNPIRIGEWEPKNDNEKFNGSTTLRNAIMWSRNIPAINIVNSLSPSLSYSYLTDKFHFSSVDEKVDKNLSAMALGGMSEGVSVIEMTAAYNTFVNGGNYFKPIGYTKVENAKGEVIIDNTKNKPTRAIGKDTAFVMRDLMKGVVSSGTGGGAKINGMATAGKTGTTDKSHNRWFAGYTPYYCGVTWYGFDKPRPISYYNGVNSNPALIIWKDIMAQIHKDLESKEFDVPDDVEKRSVCPYSGKLATSSCPSTYEYITKNSNSSTYCTLKSHGLKRLDYEIEVEEEEEETEEGEEGEEGSEGEEGNTNAEDGSDTPTSEAPPQETLPPSTSDKPLIEF